MSVIIGTLVFVISHTITVTVLRKQEAAPGNTPVHSVLRIDSSLRNRIALLTDSIDIRLPHLHIGKFCIATQIIGGAQVDIHPSLSMENQGSGQLLQIKFFFYPISVIGKIIHL